MNGLPYLIKVHHRAKTSLGRPRSERRALSANAPSTHRQVVHAAVVDTRASIGVAAAKQAASFRTTCVRSGKRLLIDPQIPDFVRNNEASGIQRIGELGN